MERYFPIHDLSVRSDGDRRILDAYAAVFGVEQEIHDQEGRYLEVLSPTSFDRTIAQRADRFQTLFNHGRTVDGTPSERFSMPYGKILEVRADNVGVRTSTEFGRTDLAREVLSLVEDGIVRGMSFSGAFVATDRKRAKAGGLPTYTRTEVAMREFGVTPFPAYSDARIVGLRADLDLLSVDELTEHLLTLDDDTRALVARALGPADPRTATDNPPAPRTRVGSTTTRERQLAMLKGALT